MKIIRMNTVDIKDAWELSYEISYCLCDSKTVRLLRVDKEADVREICEGLEHHLWSSDSRPAYRVICALRSSKPVPRCAAVRVEGGGLLTEESEVKARWAVTFSGCTRLTHQLLSWMTGVLPSQLLTLQSPVIHLRLWKHRLW